MKQLLAITLVMFGVSCAAPDFFGKRDRAANAFANAILAGNSSEAKVFTDENMSGGLPWTSAVELAKKLEFTNASLSSRSYGTPSPAQRAQGITELYDYVDLFAFRTRNSNEVWRDGCLRFSMVLKNGKWVLYFITNFSVDPSGLSVDCRFL